MKNWMKYLWRTLVHYKGLYIYVKCFYYKENILRYILWGYIITCRNTKWNTSACKILYATDYLKLYIQLVFPGGSDGKASAYNAGDLGSIPGSGRYPEEGNSYPLHHSFLENSMDRRPWWAIVHGVAKSQTWLSNTHTHTHTHTQIYVHSHIKLKW